MEESGTGPPDVRTPATPPATGRELRGWRQAWGLSQPELADLTGASQSTISRAESTPDPPGPLARLAWLLGVVLRVRREHLEALEVAGGLGDTPTHRALRELAGLLRVFFPGGSERPTIPQPETGAPPPPRRPRGGQRREREERGG